VILVIKVKKQYWEQVLFEPAMEQVRRPEGDEA
jgi:hypothetical protein